MNAEEERQLIEQARQGEVEAFMMLAKEYERQIFELIYHLTANREDAADLTQETFLHAFRAIKGFRGNSSFRTWVHRIAVNLSLNFLKKRRSQNSHFEDVERLEEEGREKELETARKMASPEDSSLSQEFRTNLEKAIEELPPAYRATFSLVVLEEMSHQEAARILSCSEKTVSWRMHEIRKRLKKKLKPFLA
ncbi:MAG: sigma-70 family RNA polymerase sigma factor [Candidatus Saccharicenans sp.]|nr:sigma-70 family RNA polymerase sigma factor [Candidatus Saccharicenans sp.]